MRYEELSPLFSPPPPPSSLRGAYSGASSPSPRTWTDEEEQAFAQAYLQSAAYYQLDPSALLPWEVLPTNPNPNPNPRLGLYGAIERDDVTNISSPPFQWEEMQEIVDALWIVVIGFAMLCSGMLFITILVFIYAESQSA